MLIAAAATTLAPLRHCRFVMRLFSPLMPPFDNDTLLVISPPPCRHYFLRIESMPLITLRAASDDWRRCHSRFIMLLMLIHKILISL